MLRIQHVTDATPSNLADAIWRSQVGQQLIVEVPTPDFLPALARNLVSIGQLQGVTIGCEGDEQVHRLVTREGAIGLWREKVGGHRVYLRKLARQTGWQPGEASAVPAEPEEHSLVTWANTLEETPELDTWIEATS